MVEPFSLFCLIIQKEEFNENGGEKMEVIYEIFGETLKVRLPKEVDHCNSIDIRKEADKRIYSGKVKNIEFDFADTSFMDSSGIGMIMGRYKLIKPLGGKIILTGVSGNIERIIKVSGVYRLL